MSHSTHAGFSEPVDGDEEDDDQDGQEHEAARVRALAHDLGSAFASLQHPGFAQGFHGSTQLVLVEGLAVAR